MSITSTIASTEPSRRSLLGEEYPFIYGTFHYYAKDHVLEEDDLRLLNGDFTEATTRRLPVHDIRGRHDRFNISKDGFQVLKHHSSLLPPRLAAGKADFHDDRLMKSVYWKEISSLLKTQLGVRSAVITSTTVRDIPIAPLKDLDFKNPHMSRGGTSPPFTFAHTDFTAAGARSQIRTITPDFFSARGVDSFTPVEEQETFFQLRNEIIKAEDQAMQQAGVDDHWEWDGKNYHGPRYAMFSIWRPLEAIHRDPLALMDPRSLDLVKDVRTLPRVYRNRLGHIPEYRSAQALIAAPLESTSEQGSAPSHTWCYMSNQQPDEVYAIKLYDSEALNRSDDSVALFCPHSAFTLEGSGDQPLRKSCELRAWCIW